MSRPVISLLTDFGSRDAFVGISKGVMLGIVPDAQLVDLSHEVRPFRIRDGAVLLRRSLPSLPVGTHLAVVDPGVGTDRAPIAIRAARGDALVGPDNGLLLPAAEVLGGIVAAHRLEDPAYRLPAASATFHGRDIFSPAAAHLAAGVPIGALGPAIPEASLVRLTLPVPDAAAGELRTAVLYVDTFGNIDFAASRADLEASLGPVADGDRLVMAWAGRRVELPWATSFGGVGRGDPLLYLNSYGDVSLALNLGHAASAYDLADDVAVSIGRV